MASLRIPKKINIALPRGFDWPSALLLAAAMLTAATRLVVTKWTADLTVVQTVTMFGVVAGLLLGVSRFSARLAGYFAFAYGLFVIPWQLGLVQQNEPLWADRLASLGYRLAVIIYQLINKQTVMDSLLFLVIMSVLFWTLGVYAGYSVVRHSDGWKVIVPTGLALFVIQYYDPAIARRAWYLAFFIFFGLILVARLAFVREHRRWRANHTALPPHLSLDFIRFGVLFASVIVLLAWTAPTFAAALPTAQRLWEPIRTQWNEAVSEMNFAFASLRSTRQVFSPVYGNSAVLGRGTPLGNAQMFSVRAPVDPPAGSRFYWRARTYDIYDNGQWYSSVDLNEEFDPQTSNLVVPTGLGRWEGIFGFVSGVQMGTIFTPPQPVWLSHEARYTYLRNSDGTLDISSFTSIGTIGPGQTYEVRASISSPSINQMRQAGSDYPEWVATRYLQLPLSITPRTRQLAQDITAGLDNPYDKVAAITAWLRQNITYIEVINAEPPLNQEPLDWFLFDLKQGFCNYYATAQVVMLRSIGIPARWSIGYAQGELITENQDVPQLAAEELNYIVRNRDAHSWPEVYFPGIGWVEFEPTVSQPDILRISDNPIDPLADTGSQSPALTEENKDEENGLEDRQTPEELAARSQARLRLLYWLAGILAVVCLLAAIGLRFLPYFGYPRAPVLLYRLLQRVGMEPPETIRRWAERAEKMPPPARIIRLAPLPILLEHALLRIGARPPALLQRWARFARLAPLSKAYQEINWALNRLGRRPKLTATPAERAHSLGVQAPAALEPALFLVNEYQIETFSQRPANLPGAQEAARRIRAISLRVLFNRLFARLQRQEDRRQIREKRSG